MPEVIEVTERRLADSASVSEIFVSFQGEGLLVGQLHLFLRLAGCNLRCRYCDTPESLVPAGRCLVYSGEAKPRPMGNPLTVASVAGEIRELMARQPAVQALAVTGGEPLTQVCFLQALLEELAGEIPVVLETNGTLPELLGKVVSLIDTVSLDFKLPSNSGERALWEEHEACLRLAAGREAGGSPAVYVKLPVDGATDPREVARAAQIVARVSDQVPMFLQPIVLKGSNRSSLPVRQMEEFFEVAAKYHTDVRVLPQVHKLMGFK